MEYSATHHYALTTRQPLQMIFSIVLFTIFSIASCTVQADNNLTLQPSPTLTPEEVVNFQIKALKEASEDGISATFRFASPANRRMTGPIERFARLFDSPQYQPMLNNRGAEIKLISNDTHTAELLAGIVDTDGELHWYRFRLSRQSDSPYENCWMTDAVLAIPYPGDSA